MRLFAAAAILVLGYAVWSEFGYAVWSEFGRTGAGFATSGVQSGGGAGFSSFGRAARNVGSGAVEAVR